MDVDEWQDLTKEPMVVSAISAGGLSEYYNRMMFDETMRVLQEQYSITLRFARVNVDTQKSFEYYKDFLGRALVYFDPSIRTPMNRARTEAMLSGSCVVQVEGAHDLDRFAKPDENMVLLENNPLEAARDRDWETK